MRFTKAYATPANNTFTSLFKKTYHVFPGVYICKVESVHGTLEDVPTKTYPDVEPWGTLPHRTWLQEFTADSTGVRPPDRCSAAGWLSGSAALPPCWPMSVQLCRHDG